MTKFYVPHVAAVDLIPGLGLLTVHFTVVLVNPAARIQNSALFIVKFLEGKYRALLGKEHSRMILNVLDC